MKKISILLSGVMILSCLLSCSNSQGLDTEDPGQGDDRPALHSKVRISPTIAKATETEFEVGDAIGVDIILENGQSYVKNSRLVYDGTVFSGDLEWYDGTDICTIAARYPYREDYLVDLSTEDDTILAESFTVQTDQSAGMDGSDYIFGYISSVTPSEGPLNMVFQHQMSRLEIEVTNNSGKEFAALKVGGVIPDILLRGEIVEITPFARDGKYYALIPSQEATLVLSFTLDGEPRTAEVASAYYQSGRQHTISLTIKPETGVLAALTGEIDGWDNHGFVYPALDSDSIYGLLKKTFDGSSGRFFSRCYFLMCEMRADNVCQSGNSTDPFTHYNLYEELPSYYTQVWPIMDLVINTATNYISRSAAWDAESAHKLGENYFFRAFSYFSLVNLYARQYSIGKNDGRFPLKTENGYIPSTVAEVYDHIVSDLNQAIDLMSGGDDPSRDHGYVTSTAAKALLSRVYLYMEKNAECERICDQLLQGDPGQYLTYDLPNYFKTARTNPETIWCIDYDSDESMDMASLGSLYYSPDGSGRTGWAEFYWSDPLIELFGRYPQDLRFNAYFVQYDKADDGSKMVHWPLEGDSFNRRNALVRNVTPDPAGNYSFTYDNVEYTATRKSVAGVNNGYPQYFIDYLGQETQVFVRDNVKSYEGLRNNYPLYMMTKFSGQDGDSNLSSPVILRWAEVILNRAEARAKLGKEAEAVEDVNIIRARAGLPQEAMLSTRNYADMGYDTLLDAILDERRMEFCFEGHRFFDVFRNKKQMDRRFAGYHPWEVIDYTDPRIPYTLPVSI